MGLSKSSRGKANLRLKLKAMRLDWNNTKDKINDQYAAALDHNRVEADERRKGENTKRQREEQASIIRRQRANNRRYPDIGKISKNRFQHYIVQTLLTHKELVLV